MNFKDIVDNFSKQLFISSAMAFLCGLTQFFLSHFERSAKILRKIAVNGEKCATDSIYKGFKCGTIAGSPEVGELRLRESKLSILLSNCRVTRMLVSYDI